MLDCAIRGGTLIDGSGAPARSADLGIRAGRVAVVGRVAERAATEVDAAGRIVAPGFVDIHTHYDAQVFWDPTLRPSPLHGVTTVVGGNCGFSIAPLDPDDADYLARMLARVEGMPLESLRAGVPWDWDSFGSYLDRSEGRLAVNAGFLVGHSALRRRVMGPRAVGEEATPRDVDRMAALLRESVAEGGLGFSSSHAPTHNDGDGRPVPSRAANRDELIALARALRDGPGTALEFIPGVGAFDDERMDLMADLSRAADRPLNWNVLAPSARSPETHCSQLEASDRAAARGGRVVALTVPQVMTLRLSLHGGFIFDALPGWGPVIALPVAERARALADPALRERLEQGAASEEAGLLRVFSRWEAMTVVEAFSPAHRPLEGRTVGDIAREQGKRPFDAFLDLALADGLKTSFSPALPGDDEATWRLRAEVWRDPRTVIGASDAGAHLDMIDTFTYTTLLLAEGVRARGLLTWEEAIRELTDVPSRLYGLRDRGRLEPGAWADVVVLDPERVAPGPVHSRFDLPGGAGRLFAEASGIDRVLVNGVEIARDGRLGGARPGRVLRSGRDTDAGAVRRARGGA